MVRRSNRLPFFILAGAMLWLMVGCSQTQDVVTPITTTEITLSAERLPTPPTGMVYELWVTKGSDTVSLGKFSYDNESRRFFDLNGNPRSGLFTLQSDLLASYNSVMVSVERQPDDNATSPGPIMLIDDVTNPDDNPIELRFPLADSLWKSYVRYNLEGISDNDRYSGQGYGLWFARYQNSTYEINDTMDVFADSAWYTNTDSVEDTVIVGLDSIRYDTVMVNLLPNQLYIGSGPLVHYGVHWVFRYAIVQPNDSVLRVSLNTNAIAGVVRARNDIIDWFTQDGFALPDYTAWGWKWKGWVVLPYYNGVSMTTRWRLTPPAWRYKSSGINFIPGDDGALFTTGTFGNISAVDDANPFKGPGQIPPVAGEDFLNSTALTQRFGLSSLNVLPQQNGNVGTVFISLEPTNALTDTTNFPLLAFIRALPSNRTDIFQIPDNLNAHTVDMYNRTQTLDGDIYGPGFPKISVTLKRY